MSSSQVAPGPSAHAAGPGLESTKLPAEPSARIESNLADQDDAYLGAANDCNRRADGMVVPPKYSDNPRVQGEDDSHIEKEEKTERSNQLQQVQVQEVPKRELQPKLQTDPKQADAQHQRESDTLVGTIEGELCQYSPGQEQEQPGRRRLRSDTSSRQGVAPTNRISARLAPFNVAGFGEAQYTVSKSDQSLLKSDSLVGKRVRVRW